MYLNRPRYLHQSLPSHVLGYPHPLDEANGFAALMRLEDTRRDGIERIICEGGQIAMVRRAIRWPGRANLVVSQIAIKKGILNRGPLLDGEQVGNVVSTTLIPEGATLDRPFILMVSRKIIVLPMHRSSAPVLRPRCPIFLLGA